MEFTTNYRGLEDLLTLTYRRTYPLWDSDVIHIDTDAKKVCLMCDGAINKHLTSYEVASLNPYIANVLKALGFFEDN